MKVVSDRDLEIGMGGWMGGCGANFLLTGGVRAGGSNWRRGMLIWW